MDGKQLGYIKETMKSTLSKWKSYEIFKGEGGVVPWAKCNQEDWNINVVEYR
jgi:hypothetical protein